MSNDRVLSGMRPTGKLHLGHYHGVLANWLRLQKEYECFFFVADWHALTTDYASPGNIRENIRQMVLDWLSVGIDPDRATIFRQSSIKEHAELLVLLSMITPLPWLERNPTYKEQIQEIKEKDLSTYGFLGYPVLQTADIIIYKATKVPVGVDQAPHLELSREITRRFNHLYTPVFPEPQTLLTSVPKVLGTDGRKMSKSYNNSIYLSDSDEVITKKLKTAMTDPQRVRRDDPGDPEVCPIYAYHKIYSNEEQIIYVAGGCRTAGIGCIECKTILTGNILNELVSYRKKRDELVRSPGAIEDIIDSGNRRARELACQMMVDVREAMKL